MIRNYEEKQQYLAILKDRMDEKNYERIKWLSQSPDEWDGKDAEQMRVSVLANFTHFICCMNGPLKKQIAIFPSYEGFILLEDFEESQGVWGYLFNDEGIELHSNYEDDFIAISDLSKLSMYASLLTKRN